MDSAQQTSPLPLDDNDGPDDLSRQFGDRVRELRKRGNLTLEELSRQSGVSRAMLSKVERGEKSPTIGVAKRICRALNTSLSFLTGGEEDRRAVAVVRKDQRHVFRDRDTGFERHLLSPPIAGSSVELLLHLLPAGASTGIMPSYPSGTEKYVVVAEGELVVVIGGADQSLKQGDSLYFEANVDHSFENRSKAPCSYYLVIARRERTG